jgi:hypothetical protein
VVEDQRLADAAAWLRRMGVRDLRAGLSWADSAPTPAPDPRGTPPPAAARTTPELPAVPSPAGNGHEHVDVARAGSAASA